jgi:hypothetical protein
MFWLSWKFSSSKIKNSHAALAISYLGKNVDKFRELRFKNTILVQ